MSTSKLPEKCWHCLVTPKGKKNVAVVNDLTFDELQKTIIAPWHDKRTFVVSGALVEPSAGVLA